MEYDNTKVYDNTNKAIAFVDDGLFSKDGVMKKMASNLPILKVKVNIDGVDKEIGLYFNMVWVDGKPTNEFKLTRNGSKMLKGKVENPFIANNTSAPPQQNETTDVPFEDEIPF